MQAIAIKRRFFEARYVFFRWRSSLALLNKIGLAFAMAGLTGLMAQMRIYLPFTPVPITGQVFAVLLSGVVCGGVFGSFSQLIYICLGMLGFGWFAAFSPGAGSLFATATGGYLIGFLIAPLVIGSFTDKYISQRSFFSQVRLMMLGVTAIYIPGVIILTSVAKLSLAQALLQGVVPFIAVDLVKAILVACVTSVILPRNSYNGEIDKP